MKLSLVLATYGRAEELDRCLQSLLSQLDRDFEVLVMDQNPDDRLFPIIDRFRNSGLPIQHERLPKPGLSEARNQGIQIATGEFVGFPDDDCWYDPDMVAILCHALRADPSLSGIVANWVEQTEGGGNDSGTTNSLLSLNAWRNFRGGAASSISLFLRRTLLLEMGGFDDRLGVGKWYGAAEETDLVLRMLASGAKIKREPNARVHHAHFASDQPPLRQSLSAIKARARGTGAIYAKHNLSAVTVIRGLVAPVIRPLAKLRFGQQLLTGWAVASGRLQGMRQWRKEVADR